MKSVIQAEKECFICRLLFNVKETRCLEEHHVFQGSNRQNSEIYGLKVWLCRRHHTSQSGVHFQPRLAQMLKKYAKMAFCRNHTQMEFMKIFGKDYEDG